MKSKKDKQNKKMSQLQQASDMTAAHHDKILSNNLLRDLPNVVAKASDSIPQLNIIPTNFDNALETVNEFSNKIGLEIENKIVFENYDGVLNLQNSILKQAETLSEELNIITRKTEHILEEITLPISAAVADIGIAAVNSEQNLKLGKISLDAFEATQNLSNLCLDTIEHKQNLVLSGLQSIKEPVEIQLFAKQALPSAQMISAGLTELVTSNPILTYDFNLPGLTTIHEETTVEEEKTREHQRILDSILSKIDPKLVIYRQACWDTFEGKGKNYIGQSSSSMRRLVDTLLRTVAPDEKAMDTEYFKRNKDARTKSGYPKRKTRIYCILDYDQEAAERFRRLAKGFLEAYDNLPAWDHEPLKKDEFVHGVFITIEGYLLSLLSERSN